MVTYLPVSSHRRRGVPDPLIDLHLALHPLNVVHPALNLAILGLHYPGPLQSRALTVVITINYDTSGP